MEFTVCSVSDEAAAFDHHRGWQRLQFEHFVGSHGQFGTRDIGSERTSTGCNQDLVGLHALTLAKHLDTCAHHALVLGGLRELRRALMDLPAEAVVRLAPRALERACELLAATNPKLSTPETRREALHVIQQCASALHQELRDASRECLIAPGSVGRGGKTPTRAGSPRSTVDYAPSVGEAYFSTGSATRSLPVAHG